MQVVESERNLEMNNDLSTVLDKNVETIKKIDEDYCTIP